MRRRAMVSLWEEAGSCHDLTHALGNQGRTCLQNMQEDGGRHS